MLECVSEKQTNRENIYSTSRYLIWKKTKATKTQSWVGSWSYLGVCAFMCVSYSWKTLHWYRPPHTNNIDSLSCLPLFLSFSFSLIVEGHTETMEVLLRSPRATTLDLHHYYNKPPSQAADMRRIRVKATAADSRNTIYCSDCHFPEQWGSSRNRFPS